MKLSFTISLLHLSYQYGYCGSQMAAHIDSTSWQAKRISFSAAVG